MLITSMAGHMSKQLPTSVFEWMTDDELDDWKHLSCFLEVDI